MAARGNRLVAIGRLGVAFFATAAVALGSALPASAQDPAPAPATTTPAETTPAETPTAATEATEPESPTPEPAAAPKEPAPPADAQPAGGAAESATPAPTAPAPESAPAEHARRSAEHACTEHAGRQRAGGGTGPVVKLEPEAPTSTPTAPLAAPTAHNDTTHSATTQPTPTTAAAVTFQLQEPTVEPQPSATEAANSDGETAPTAQIVSLKEPAAAAPISLLPAARRGRRDGPRHPRGERPRQAARPADLRPTDSTRATLAGLQAGARDRGSSRHTHLVAQPGGAGSNRPGGGPGDDPEGRSTSAAGVEGRQEAHGGEGTTNRPLRPFRPGDRQRRLQRRDRNDVVVAPVRARSSALEGAAAVPIRPLAPAEHASAWRDRRSSHCSTGIALHDSSTRRPGWEDPRPAVSRV